MKAPTLLYDISAKLGCTKADYRLPRQCRLVIILQAQQMLHQDGAQPLWAILVHGSCCEVRITVNTMGHCFEPAKVTVLTALLSKPVTMFMKL